MSEILVGVLSSRDSYQRRRGGCWGCFLPRPPIYHFTQYLSKAIPIKSFFSHICRRLFYPYSECVCTSQNQKNEKYIKHGSARVMGRGGEGINLIYKQCHSNVTSNVTALNIEIPSCSYVAVIFTMLVSAERLFCAAITPCTVRGGV